MRTMSYRDAIRAAMLEEMRRDPAVVVFCEDARFWTMPTNGFVDEFGPDRVPIMPISEEGFTGAAIGAAMTGLRPIVDYTISNLMYVAWDQLVNHAAKNRYLFGGQTSVPIVFRAAMKYANATAAQHSDRPYPQLMNVPGLKIVVPSTPADALGLLKSAIRDDDPVVYFEPLMLWGRKGEVPDGDHLVPIGRAAVAREGSDVTVVAIGDAVPAALTVAEHLAGEGIEVEVIDPRTLVPLDTAAILDSVAKTGRLVVADPAHRTCGAAAEISARVAEEGFDSLRAPIVRVTAPDVHPPFSPVLERLMYPTPERIHAAVRAVLRNASTAATAAAAGELIGR
ncbi:alpha-ketoacid dehydrogenase subunit beta [Trujillonella endophytica]|uniref:Pyruvate dehydrogenase E1 component beta subunit n=1 Tax=Trujillonella endophytica TaxID=673521 RepID=A0A1H8WGL7_9ACTN|nr:alpha-ketoacid dehydrogenase subunit beta [Trujillella endophytica]SEP26790.1 pyruvate dehydrogenase E1 component beta subunit [Trujillella endophytica]